MEVVPLADAGEVARVAADAIASLVARKPRAALGVATGGTPRRTYDEVARRHAAGDISFTDVRLFLLDEYVGLPPGHDGSYLSTVLREIAEPWDVPLLQVHGPDPTRLPGSADDYERLIAELGGIDLQVLGIGSDGHLGFNEPGSSLASRTRIKTLTGRTRADNAAYFEDEEVPHHVVTQGIGTILEARHLLLLATGAAKAQAVAAAVEGPISASCPASVLQLHPHVTVLLDSEAASGLRRLDYYREVYAGKPEWQGL
ncbi:MAG: glucosamine-6-phosphate deaminase [Nocardioides sp.]|nr:glucosamine-6-phosphate deaminase [Nocardioides sp.]